MDDTPVEYPHPGVLWTRELLLEAAGFQPAKDVRRALTRTRRALNAVKGEGEPDHAIRLKAAEQVYELADVKRVRDADVTDPRRPVAVTLILTDTPRPVLPSHGVTLHLDGGNGDRR